MHICCKSLRVSGGADNNWTSLIFFKQTICYEKKLETWSKFATKNGNTEEPYSTKGQPSLSLILVLSG